MYFLVRLLYRFEVVWVGERPESKNFKDTKLICILNHTSLFEFLLIGGIPKTVILHGAKKAVIPVADITMNRALVGSFIRMILPNPMSISRKRDHTWQAYLDSLSGDRMAMIFPEGRMRRASGFDKEGQDMSVRGGIADILSGVREGHMLLVHSGGLHHIQKPGVDKWPRFFKPIRVRLEWINISKYKKEIGFESEGYKGRLIQDMQKRHELNCPESDYTYPGFEDPFY